MKTLKIPKREGEYWWGGYVESGNKMPVPPDGRLEIFFRKNLSLNQANPVLLSSGGRYIASEGYFDAVIGQREIVLKWDDDGPTPEVAECGDLKSAYLKVMRGYFPYNGKLPPEEFFSKPQYNTWISLMYWQSQEGVLAYAESAHANGAKGGIFFIDCGWQKDFGIWEFNERFPDPEAMVRRLHELGFKVMLWVVPFVSPDSDVFRKLREQRGLVETADGKPFITEWWDGYSAAVDLSSTAGRRWFRETLNGLQDRYAVDGFKFDAGDPRFYGEDNRTSGNLTPNGESEIWADFASEYAYNELRACCKQGGKALVQRIADQYHDWEENNGLAGLISKCLVQSMFGYGYLCPDMVGGGLYSDFLGKSGGELDRELFIRYCQAAALMPMMQFSFDYWRVFDAETVAICNRYGALHEQFGEYILRCAKEAAAGGLPIIRNMAMQFNDLYDVRDQFMLGEDILVAPVLKAGVTKQKVQLPAGAWRYVPTGEEMEGGRTVWVDAPLEVLPYFERR